MTTLEKPHFGAESTASDVLRGVDLRGKFAVVTGGGGGLGKETARALAAAGADVVIGGRSIENITTARDELAQAGGGEVSAFELDLTSFASVDAFANSVLALDRPIDIFIANAGIMASPLERTADGHEMQFATNFLGHAALTSRLAPAIRRSSDARVVILSSSGHHFSSVDLDDLDWRSRPYDKWKAYGQSKTACALLAVKVAGAMQADGVTALSLHPGVIGTGLMRHLTAADYEALKTRNDVPQPAVRRRKTVEQGAATSVWAATAPELKGRILYLEDCQIAQPTDSPNTVSGVLPYALDTQLADGLWTATERLIGRELPL